jgi:hypothetical protein
MSRFYCLFGRFIFLIAIVRWRFIGLRLTGLRLTGLRLASLRLR